jgi:hypothetical protein
MFRWDKKIQPNSKKNQLNSKKNKTKTQPNSKKTKQKIILKFSAQFLHH